MKLCCKCKTEKHKAEFYANKRQYDGLSTYCKPCHKRDTADRNSKKLKNNEGYRNRKKLECQQWRTRNSDQQADYRAKYYENNSHYWSAYNQKNKGKRQAYKKKREVALINRTPKWLDQVDLFEMECIYIYASALRNVGLKYEVDHKYPLQGKNISGLHVPLNLRVLRESENRKKHNKFEV